MKHTIFCLLALCFCQAFAFDYTLKSGDYEVKRHKPISLCVFSKFLPIRYIWKVKDPLQFIKNKLSSVIIHQLVKIARQKQPLIAL